jgi:2-keto-4-pentenoate hydratase/2-oxohepta-3-ene-1,7-dioic acid hydratase in catechol pathway
MRVASYLVDGHPAWGLVTADGTGLIDATGVFPTVKAALAAGGLEEVHRSLAGRTADRPLSGTTLLPVITDPDKILCVGLNYDDHRQEGGHPEQQYPTFFTRFANSQIAHGQPMIKPAVSDKLDYEAELAVVIGKAGRHIPTERAFEHVAGYAPYNDGSVRDWQRHTTQFTPGKNFVGTGGFGPWMSTPDEIQDLDAVVVEARLNGEFMQHATVADMLFSIPALIAYASTFTELVPGDVIATGTPGGVGSRRTPPVWMKAGDVIEIEIGGVGTLRNTVAAE